MNRLNPAFLLLFVTLLLWASATGLGNYLAGDRTGKNAVRNPKANDSTAAASISEADLKSLGELRKKVEVEPGNSALKLELARSLMATAGQSQANQGLAMEAVQLLSKLTETDPQNSEAMLLLARICLDHGIFDKAAKYFRSYVALVPTDLKAQVDLGLAVLQTGNPKEAEEILSGTLKQDPTFFPAQLSLALTYRVQGQLDQARTFAEAALKHAPDDIGRETIQRFLASLDGNITVPPPLPQAHANDPEKVSPGMLVDNFFRSHQIIGPKLVKIDWPKADVVQIHVQDFPVQAMPDFAKSKFISNVENSLAALPHKTEVQIVDGATSQVLLSIPVGAPRG